MVGRGLFLFMIYYHDTARDNRRTSEPLFRVCFVVLGESPDCRLFSTASMLEWLRKLLPHHSQGSSTERWSRNTLRVVTASVYVLRGSLTSPFILNNSVETAGRFNVVNQPRCCEPRNWSLEKFLPLTEFITCDRCEWWGMSFLNHSNIEAVPNKRQPGDSPRTTKQLIERLGEATFP